MLIMGNFNLTPNLSTSIYVSLRCLFSYKLMTQWFCYLMNNSDGKFKNVKFKAVKK